jgi:4-hydroxybenzoate polyprenyltransferase
MGAPPARAVAARRSRARAYLRLSRLSNLPTVWSNVVAGWSIARGGALDVAAIAAAAVAVSAMYTGGMFLNDAFDAKFDTSHRADRPIPSGDVTRGEVFTAGFALVGAGVLMLVPVSATSVLWSLALAAAIVAYNYRHKAFRFGPIVMGVCRGLVYCVAAAAAASTVSVPVLLAAALLAAYTASLTLVAKRVGARAAAIVPVMIAGLSLVDAAFIVWSGGGVWAAAFAVACFALTLALQRVVPGT